MAKQVFDINTNKGAFSAAMSDEHQRKWNDERWQFQLGKPGNNYDRSREHMNFEIAKGGRVQAIDRSKNIPQKFLERCAELGIRNPDYKTDPKTGKEIPTNRITTAKIIFQGSRERMRELAFGEQKVNQEHGADNSHITRCKDIEEWAKDIYRFASKQWGEDNILGFYVHLDELNPHIHCTVLPVATIRKKPNVSFNRAFWNLRNKSEVLNRLHDELAEVNRRWGLERGDKIAETGARHRTTEEYRRHLTAQCTSLETQIEDSKQALSQLRQEVSLAEKRVKGLTTMVENLESRKGNLENEIAWVEDELRTGKGNSEELQKRIAKLDYELQKVLENLSDKRGKLEVADRRLAELKWQEEDSKLNVEHNHQELRQATYDLERQVQYRLSDALVSDLIADFTKQLSTMDYSVQKLFDDSLIRDMAEHGQNIFKCAMYLYAGYVDYATTFAESHGGGGGSNDLPWKRDEDEDDRAWARRCLRQAHRMMRPGGKRIKR